MKIEHKYDFKDEKCISAKQMLELRLGDHFLTV